jgi:hypothetical protein
MLVDFAAMCTAFLTMFTAGRTTGFTTSGTVSAFLRRAGAAVKSNDEEGEEEAD